MALRRLGFLIAQTTRLHDIPRRMIIPTRMSDCSLLLVHPPLGQPPAYRHKHTVTDSNEDVKNNIMNSITQSAKLVTPGSVLYHRTAFNQILNTMFLIGFKDKEITDLFVTTTELLHSEASILEQTLQVLRSEGFSVRQTIKILKQMPREITASLDNITQVVHFFRDVVMLPDGHLQDVVTSHQELLLTDARALHANHEKLMGVFRRSDISRMLRRHPVILLQSEEDLEAKVMYVNKRMGLEQNDMVWASILNYSLEHIRARHQCVLRSGIYEMPDKKGDTYKPNPFLKDILGGTDAAFAKMAGITVQEFEVLRKLLEVERAELIEDFQNQLTQFEEDEDENTSGYVKENVRKDRMRKKIIDY